jgi:aldose 1-epimerase
MSAEVISGWNKTLGNLEKLQLCEVPFNEREESGMSIAKKHFGVLESGEDVHLFILTSGDISVTLSEYGATIVSIFLPAGKGRFDDIALGLSTLAGYTSKHPFFGVTVGRYANRIAKASFTLSGNEYRLVANDGPNNLHGGPGGFDSRLWKGEAFKNRGEPAVRMTRTSLDGEAGFPGELNVAVTFTLRRDGALSISYEARCSAETIVNLTNHSYFNLKGEGRGTILDHRLRMACSKYLPVDANLIPTGLISDVSGGPFDFLAEKEIGRDITAAGGYDHCFVLDRSGPGLVDCAWVTEPATGRRMVVSTTLPGVQLYSGNFLEGSAGKRGGTYVKHGGLCLETELFPDSPNRPEFPTARLLPGQVWSHETVYRFLC